MIDEEERLEMARKVQPILMKIVVDPLISLFVNHARIQRDQLIADLKRFSIFNSLDNTVIEKMASPNQTGIPRISVHEYVPNEIIVDEGQYGLDCLFLVV